MNVAEIAVRLAAGMSAGMSASAHPGTLSWVEVVSAAEGLHAELVRRGHITESVATFDWSGVPARFKWAAMDVSGQWYFYEKRPTYDEDKLEWDAIHGACFNHGFIDYPGRAQDSLQKRPKDA